MFFKLNKDIFIKNLIKDKLILLKAFNNTSKLIKKYNIIILYYYNNFNILSYFNIYLSFINFIINNKTIIKYI